MGALPVFAIAAAVPDESSCEHQSNDSFEKEDLPPIKKSAIGLSDKRSKMHGYKFTKENFGRPLRLFVGRRHGLR